MLHLSSRVQSSNCLPRLRSILPSSRSRLCKPESVRPTISFAGYGQGAEGYGKRFGAAFADEVSASFFGNFFYPTLFQQDPRYFRLGRGGFMRRFGYSLAQEFVCHTDSGGRAFNLSSVLGVFTAGSVSNFYY